MVITNQLNRMVKDIASNALLDAPNAPRIARVLSVRLENIFTAVFVMMLVLWEHWDMKDPFMN